MLAQRATRAERMERRRMRRGAPWQIIALVGVALAVQLTVIVLRSRSQWQHFDLSWDFAIFHQAWHEIGAGELDPRSTLLGYPFWRSHLELIMWPLALLGGIGRADGRALLYLQDLASVAAEAVVVAWVWSVARQRLVGWRRLVPVVVAIVLLLANPWIYRSTAEDFHLEVFGVLFALLAGWDLSRDRRRGWIWVMLTLSCGDVAGLYIAGLGLSMLLVSGRTRRRGLVLLACGVGWIVFAALIGAGKGSDIRRYAYLASNPHSVDAGLGGAAAVLAGVFAHPSRVVESIGRKLGLVWRNVATTGTVGLVAPWGAGVALLALLANALTENRGFVASAFQNTPVYYFGALGTALLVVSLLGQRFPQRTLAALLVTAGIATALVFDARQYPLRHAYRVSARAAAELAVVYAKTPGDAQVVSTFGTVGRFADRRSVQVVFPARSTIPVQARTVVFVLAPTAGNQPIAAASIDATRAFVRDRLGAKIIHSGPHVTAYLWHPSGQRSVTLP